MASELVALCVPTSCPRPEVQDLLVPGLERPRAVRLRDRRPVLRLFRGGRGGAQRGAAPGAEPAQGDVLQPVHVHPHRPSESASAAPLARWREGWCEERLSPSLAAKSKARTSI